MSGTVANPIGITNPPIDDLLQSMPGLGKVRARQVMERLGIAESRRVRGLGTKQVAALEREFAARD